jgi:uncharacterized protein involved in exopolysaccharide biosynthesis
VEGIRGATAGTGRAAGVRDRRELTLVAATNVLLRQRRLVAGLALSAGLVVGVVSVLSPRTYTASAVFMPQASQLDRSGASVIAAQLGLQLGGGAEATESPAFYADLLQSTPLLRAVVEGRYSLAGRELTLVELMGGQHPEPNVRASNAVQALRQRLSVATRRATGVVAFSLRSSDADLSRQIAQRMIELVNEFNVERRQSQAANERRFVEERLAAVNVELEAAEDELQRFLERNRQFVSRQFVSPELDLERDRLQRKVLMRQQVMTSMAQAYEQARIAEVRNLPVITVVEAPESPARPDRRRTASKVGLALIIGGMLGLFLAFGRDYVARIGHEEPDEVEEFGHLRAQVLSELLPWRTHRRRVPSSRR